MKTLTISSTTISGETPGVAAGHVKVAGLFEHEGGLAAQSDRDDG